MTADEGPEGFLARWSRRKRQATAPAREEGSLATPAREDPPPVAPAREDAPPAVPDASTPDGPPAADRPGEGEPAFDPATLPPLEDLTAESDLRPFLQPRVPAALRQAAMRRMWSLDPLIRDFVGPADYAWDFNAPDGVPGFALELGGDAARLLAQAIGQGPSPAGPANPPAPRDATGGPDAAGTVPVHEAPGAPAAPPRPAEPPPRDPMDGPTDRRLDAIAEAPSPRRGELAAPPPPREDPADRPWQGAAVGPIPPRRHGGALPR